MPGHAFARAASLREEDRIVSPSKLINEIPIIDGTEIASNGVTYIECLHAACHLRLSDFTAHPDKVPYRLSFLEHGQTSGSILVNAIEQIVPGITNPKLNEYQRRVMARAASFAGKPLWQQGFWNVLARVISNEAFELGVDAGGYQSTRPSATGATTRSAAAGTPGTSAWRAGT